MRNFLLGGDQKEFSNYYAYAIFAKLSRKRTANVTKKPRERFTDRNGAAEWMVRFSSLRC